MAAKKKMRWVKFQTTENNFKYLEELIEQMRANEPELDPDYNVGDLYHEAMTRVISVFKLYAHPREDLHPAHLRLNIYTAIPGEADDARKIAHLPNLINNIFPFHTGTINFGITGLPGKPRGGSKAKDLKRWWKRQDAGWKGEKSEEGD